MEEFCTYYIYYELYEIHNLKVCNFYPLICVYALWRKLCEEYLKKNVRVLVHYSDCLGFNIYAFVVIIY
jgi:hypothetical protein